MPSAASLRLQIETELGSRIPGALTPRPRTVRDITSSGVLELDALLDGGFPVGAISELVGTLSSGRTTLALAAAAEMTQAGKSVAWIDTTDALSPESAAAAGVDLARQLWVRCGGGSQAAPDPNAQPQPTAQGAALVVEGSRTPSPSGGCGSPHPRGEVRGLSQAVDAFLQPDVFSRPAPPRDPAVPRRDRTIGTPGAPNRKLLDRTPQDPRPFPRRAKDREEQIPSDRQPSRRQVQEGQQRSGSTTPKSLGSAQIENTVAAAENQPRPGHWSDNSNNAHGRAFHTAPNAIAAGLPRFRQMEAESTKAAARVVSMPAASLPPLEQAGKASSSLAGERPAKLSRAASPLWQALDQALRVTDLLLAAGGFSAIILDLGSVPAEFSWRIPLATWFRFRAAADRTRTVLLVLTQHPCARSSAELVLRLAAMEPQSATTVLTGACFRLTVDRRRFDTDQAPTPKAEHTPTPNTLHLVTPRKQPQRDCAWHRAAAWTGTQLTQTGGRRP